MRTSGVRLTLSTAQPSSSSGPPTLLNKSVSIKQPPKLVMTAASCSTRMSGTSNDGKSNSLPIFRNSYPHRGAGHPPVMDAWYLPFSLPFSTIDDPCILILVCTRVLPPPLLTSRSAQPETSLALHLPANATFTSSVLPFDLTPALALE